MTKTKLNNFIVKIINSLPFFILFGFIQSLNASGHLLITEIKVTPTDGEFIEIYNASPTMIDLSNVYLTDATYATGEKYYYKVVQQAGMSGAGAGYYDFNAKFPFGASINPGEVKVIAITGAGFKSTYGYSADYEILGNDADTPDMLEAEPGSIDSNAGLTNDGEVVILYIWDGNSDLIYDLDYVVWGDKAEAVDKSGVSIDGIDSDSDESSYLNDTPISIQIVVASNAHSYENSWQRNSITEEGETLSGGNGIDGHDETSENISVSFIEDVPTPSDVPFGGDTTPPTILSVTALSNINVEITFSEALNDTMAENENNYSISPFLAITEAELKNENKVLLTTEEQTEDETYTITVYNVEDLAGNPIEPNSTITFTGFAGDTTPPTITNVQAHSLINVEITFSEALNDTMAGNETNYSISPSLDISSAELEDGNKVLLATGEQNPGQSYFLTIQNIADTSGNVMPDTTIDFTGYQEGEYNLIADIQNNFDDYEGHEVTVRGVVTIGDGLLKPNMTKFYIQDSSEKGIQIYNYSPLSTTYIRGDYIEVTGIVDKYENDVEIKNPTVTLLAQEENLPLPHIMVGDEDLTMNGTWAKVTGEITDVWDAEEYGFYQITVSVSGTEIPFMFWNSTGVDVSEYEEGDNVKTYGVITFYTDGEGVTTTQLTCGYEEDISLYSGEEYFEITPINPQPYDTVTVTFTCPDNYTGDCDTVRLLWRTIQHHPFKSIIMNSVEGTYNEYKTVIPGQPEATIVYFYFAVTDTSSGKITNFPENAPYTLESYKYDVASLKAILKVPPRTFCPTLGEKFEIQVHSRKDDKIILRLYNSEGKLVYTFFNKLSNGSESFEWDGKDETWNTLPPGLYICHLEVIDRNTGKTKTEVVPIVIAVPLKH